MLPVNIQNDLFMAGNEHYKVFLLGQAQPLFNERYLQQEFSASIHL